MCDDQQFGITPWRNNSPACNLSMKLDKDELVEVRKLAFAFKPATIQSLRDKINKLMREDHRCVQRSNSERIERLQQQNSKRAIKQYLKMAYKRANMVQIKRIPKLRKDSCLEFSQRQRAVMGDYHRNSPEEIDSPFRSLLKINLKDKMKKGKVSLFAPKASLDYHYPSVNNKDTSRRYHKPLLLRVKEDQVQKLQRLKAMRGSRINGWDHTIEDDRVCILPEI